MMFRQLKVGERLQPFTGTTGQGQAAMLVIAVVDVHHDSSLLLVLPRRNDLHPVGPLDGRLDLESAVPVGDVSGGIAVVIPVRGAIVPDDRDRRAGNGIALSVGGGGL